MSNKYKFEFVDVTDDQKIVWKLRSRLGQEWLGNFEVIGCTDDCLLYTSPSPRD